MNKTLWRATLWAGLLATGLLACARAPAADSERAALEAAIHRWVTAVNAQDVATLTSTMTGDVELLDDASTMTGRDAAIRALCVSATRGRLLVTTREITIVDDVGWHVAGLARTQKNGDVQARGRALEIWKHVKGEWQLHRRMTTGVVAPELVPARPATDEPVLDRGNRQGQ
jgi:ketosteroid isomerase-like protein